MPEIVDVMSADEFDYERLKIRDLSNTHEEDAISEDAYDSDSMELFDAECDGGDILSLMPENPDYEQLFEDTGTMIDDYVRENVGRMSNPAFHDEVTGYVFDQLRIVMFASVGETHAVDSDRAHYLMHRMIETGMNYYFTNLHECDRIRFSPWRSEEVDDGDDDDVVVTGNISPELISKVLALQEIQNQTEQRTDAWYARRHSLITASAAWKAFGTDSVVNQLIYEKCKPYVAAPEDGFVNVDSPLHWGQKYEFLSAQLYQVKNNTRIGEFGCIQHPDPRLSFIGGSPDGINIDESSPLFGRMVEIKNIVNREITGVPKEEYWIQMQIQMAVCGMEECDFVETRFKEYDDAQDYYDDVQIDYAYANANRCNATTNDDCGCERGIILYFADLRTRKPHYEYMPMEYRDVETQEAWITNTIARFDKSPAQSEYIWIRNIYWKLDQYSCVLVRRNHSWFNDYAAPRLERVWRTIETERNSGYDHRAPKKRTISSNMISNSNNGTKSTCGIVL